MRAIITLGSIIVRTITSPPEMFAAQAHGSEAIFALTDDDGGVVDDRYVRVSESGELENNGDAPMGHTAPRYALGYVAR